MAVTDVSMLRERRKKKKLLSAAKKLGIAAAIGAAVLAVVLTRGIWYPKLDGILTKIPVPENTAEFAEGYFPISIEGGARYQLMPLDSSFAVVDDSHFFVYSEDGKMTYSDQHAFSNPIINVFEKKALLYDLGGKSFGLYSKYKNIYVKNTDEPILIARLGANDTAAVVTKSEKYPSALMVYDASGKNIFNYRSVSRVIDVTFNDDSSGCYITTIGANGGVIVSKMLYYRFDKVDFDDSGNPVPIWQTDNLNTLAISVRRFGDGNIILFGDTMCAYYDTNGKFINSYDYKHRLAGYSSEGGTAALVFRNDERRSSELVTIDSLTGEINEINLGYEAMNIQISENAIYLQSRGGIEALSTDGTVLSSVDLYTDYNGFCRINGYIYLLGYDEINRINFN